MIVIKKYIGLEALLFVIVGASVGLYLITYVKSQPVQFHSDAAFTSSQQVTTPPTTSLQATQTPVKTTIPSKTQKTSTTIALTTPIITNSTSQISSDGTQTVTVQTVQNKYGTQTDNIFTANETVPLYSKTLSQGESINIPYNTWSPDDKYFFLQDTTAAGQAILVFQANGQPFANGQTYLNVTDAYKNYGSNDIFDQATGWAANNLIIIITKAPDGTEGTSYWYEVPDGSIIPLATKF